MEFIERVQAKSPLHVPGIIVSGTSHLSEQQVSEIHKCARAGAVRYAPAMERVLEESVLLLHRKESTLNEEQKNLLGEVRQADRMLAGRKVLVVDDDSRNIFALTSVLEQRELKVLHAENGRAGIELLKTRSGRGHRADGHHDAGDGRLRNHARDPRAAAVCEPSDRRSDGQGDEGRSRKVPAGGRVGLCD